MSGGIVNNFAEAIDITIRVKHKNWSKNKTVVDDTLAPLGDVRSDASDFQIDIGKTEEYSHISRTPPAVEEYSFKITDEHLKSFKKLILKKYGENIRRCMDCEHCILILDEEYQFKDLECKLGAGKLSMISNSNCLLPYGG